MTDSVIELVQLKNGDIVLRNSQEPEHPLVTFSFSNFLHNMTAHDRMAISKAMVEAGIVRFQELHNEHAEELIADHKSDLVH